MPTDLKVTYTRIVASLCPHKKEIHRVRVTAGVYRLEYTGVTTTQAASISTTKCLINSILSTPNPKFMSADIKDYYYGTVLTILKYTRMSLKDIPDEIIRKYN